SADPAETVTSPAPGSADMCAVLVSWRTDDEADSAAYQRSITQLMGVTVESIEGGMVMLFAGDVTAAARVALVLAEQFPRALVAVAAADTVEQALDDGAHLVEDLELADTGDEP